MIKFFLILTAVLFVGILLLFFLWRSEKTKRKETQGKLESTNKELARAIAEQAKLESTIQILRKKTATNAPWSCRRNTECTVSITVAAFFLKSSGTRKLQQRRTAKVLYRLQIFSQQKDV